MALTAVTVSSLREKLRSYLDRVSSSMETLVVSRGSDERDAVVIMSIETYNALTETQYLMSTKANRENLFASIQQLEAGKVKTVNDEDIDRLIKARRSRVEKKGGRS